MPDEVKVELMDFIGKYPAPPWTAVVGFNVAAEWKGREMVVVENARAIMVAVELDFMPWLKHVAER